MQPHTIGYTSVSTKDPNAKDKESKGVAAGLAKPPTLTLSPPPSTLRPKLGRQALLQHLHVALAPKHLAMLQLLDAHLDCGPFVFGGFRDCRPF